MKASTIVVATALMAAAGGAAAQAAPEATLYWDSGFAGRTHEVSGEIRNLTSTGFNDQISSLRLQGRWEVCEHEDFGGRCEVLSGDVRDLGGWSLNDRITSMRPAPDRPGRPDRPDRPDWDDRRNSAVAYRDANFLGAETRIEGEQSNLAATGFNDQISSLRLRGRWEVCSDSGFGGACQVLEGDIRNLSDHGLNDRISSMRPTRGYGDSWGGGWGRGQRVMVYRDAHYAGPSRELRGEQSDLAAIGLNDQISSLRLEGEWEACTDAGFQGRCEVFEDSISNLSSVFMNDEISSLRPYRRWNW